MKKFELTEEQIETIRKQARSECARKAILARHAKMTDEQKAAAGKRLNDAVRRNKLERQRIANDN